MAINSSSSSITPNRSSTPLQTTGKAAAAAPPKATGPTDSVTLGSGDPTPATATKKPDFSSTPGGRTAKVTLKPNATQFFEKTADELDQARAGDHPRQTSTRELNELREKNAMFEPRREYQRVEQEVVQEKTQAETRYQQAEKKVAGGFQKEKAEFDLASKDVALTQRTFDRKLGKPTREKLEKWQDLSRRLKNGDIPESMESNYRSFLSQMAGELRQKGVDVDKLEGERAEPHSKQAVAQDLMAAQKELERAGDFPRTKEAQGQWLAERGAERDRAVEAADGKLKEARAKLDTRRAAVRGKFREEEAAQSKSLVHDLQERLERDRSISLYSMRDEFRKSDALANGGYSQVKLKESGLVITSYDDKVPPAELKSTADGGVQIVANTPTREAVSKFTPDGEGYRESSSVKEYSTVGGGRRLAHETVREKDSTGQVLSSTDTSYEYDGGKRVDTYRKTDTGEERSMRQTDAEGKLTYSSDSKTETVDGVKTQTRRTERRGQVELHREQVQPDGSKRIEDATDRPDGTHYRSLMTVGKDGHAESHTRDERKGSDGKLRTTERISRDGVLMETKTTEPVKPELDVPGLGWIGSHNPQDLVERLGDEDGITAEKTTISRRQEDGTYANQETTTMRSADGKTELIQSQGPHGGNAWELREKNPDGTWNSQVFLQGTDDNIVTKTRKEGGFTVEERTSHLEELAKSNDKVPPQSHTVTRNADAATAGQVNDVLKKSTVGEITNTDAFKKFMADSGDGPFQVVSTDSDAKDKKGNTSKSSSFIMEAPDGRKLAAVYDEKSKTYTLKTFDSNGEVTSLAAITKVGDSLEKLEVDAEGKATTSVASASGNVRSWVRTAEDVVTAPHHVAKGVRAVARLDEALIGANQAGKLGQMSKLLADGKWAGRIGVGAGGAAALLSGMSLTADLMSGDYAGATRTAGTLGMDIATIAKAANSDSFMNPALAAGKAGRWAAQGSRYLGIAGAVTSVVFAGVDAYEGKWVRAGLGAASAGGAALALFGTASIAGPLGWGIAGAASIAMMAWDYNEGTHIAPYAL